MRISLPFVSLVSAFVLNVHAQDLTGETQTPSLPLLEQSIAYHDPQNKWPSFNATMAVVMKSPKNTERTTRIFMDHAKGLFELNATRGTDHTQYVLGPNQCDIAFNGRTRFNQEEIKTHRLDCSQAARMKNYYTYLYGLPMKLKDPGTQMDPIAYKKMFQGETFWVIKVSYDPSVGKDVWYFYIDTNTYALRHYQFFHDEQKGDGEYILLSGETEVGGVKMPKDRAWYTNLENNYLGTDYLSAVKE